MSKRKKLLETLMGVIKKIKNFISNLYHSIKDKIGGYGLTPEMYNKFTELLNIHVKMSRPGITNDDAYDCRVQIEKIIHAVRGMELTERRKPLNHSFVKKQIDASSKLISQLEKDVNKAYHKIGDVITHEEIDQAATEYFRYKALLHTETAYLKALNMFINISNTNNKKAGVESFTDATYESFYDYGIAIENAGLCE